MELANSFEPSFNNLTREERSALRALQSDKSIVIKVADKGSSVVVWDRDDYLREAESQLNDTEVYEEYSGGMDTLLDQIHRVLQKGKEKGEFSNDNIDYLMINNPRIGRFYLLPKIHKGLNGVLGRPVVSHIDHYTENISSFVDFHLQPLAKAVHSYIKDTNDFLCKLKNLKDTPEDIIMCSLDVKALYPSIPNEEGISAMKMFLENRRDKRVSTQSLQDLTELVLTNNIFDFNGKIYRQKRGTAMGTKMAPPYAILFMAALEESFLKQCTHKPTVWWRYIDDIFMLWPHGEDSLNEFLSSLNSYHETIKFTYKQSRNEVEFLDVRVVRKNGKFITDLYTKPTDTHQFLDPSSCHPYHCKKAIPYSQALRLNRICSEDDDFENRCEDLYDWLMERGYKHKLVEEQIKKACEFDRDNLLSRRKAPTNNKENRLSLNITYHPAFNNLGRVLKDLQVIIGIDSLHREVFKEIPRVGFSNGKSLKSILVKSTLPKLESEENKRYGCVTCGGGKGRPCEVCKHIRTTTNFTSHVTKETFKIEKGPLNCNSTNVVYLVECKVCGLQNVGSTVTKYRARLNNYKSVHRKFRSQATKEKSKSGYKVTIFQEKFHEHFCDGDHSGIDDWVITLIDSALSEKSLREKELFWQYKLETFFPLGLNEVEAIVDIT